MFAGSKGRTYGKGEQCELPPEKAEQNHLLSHGILPVTASLNTHTATNTTHSDGSKQDSGGSITVPSLPAPSTSIPHLSTDHSY